MANTLLFNVSALAALLPAAIFGMRRQVPDGALFWAVTLLAAAGPAIWIALQWGEGWPTGLSHALWTVITAVMVLYAGLCRFYRPAWRLSPILAPYVLLLGLCALLTASIVPKTALATSAVTWLYIHVFFSIFAYALVTLAAVAAVAVVWRERILKQHRRSALSDILPSILEAERLQFRFLLTAEVFLAASVSTGMAVQFLVSGHVLSLDHKTLLALAAFFFIGVYLLIYAAKGVGGRKTANIVFGCFALMTLAYPGVKFIADVLQSP